MAKKKTKGKKQSLTKAKRKVAKTSAAKKKPLPKKAAKFSKLTGKTAAKKAKAKAKPAKKKVAKRQKAAAPMWPTPEVESTPTTEFEPATPTSAPTTETAES